MVRMPGIGLGARFSGNVPPMRLMFTLWVALIASGIVFFAIVGLSHR
jgi:hypothetical protein